MSAEPADTGAGTDWTGALPEAVRQRVIALAAQALGALAVEDVPASLRPFRRFAPGRRARLAAAPIAAALERDEPFRLRVSSFVRESLPDLTASLTAGTAPAAADPLEVAALAYLLRPDGWAAHVAAAAEYVELSRRGQRTAGAAETIGRLREQLAATKAQAREEVARLRQELATSRTEVAELRRKLFAARDARKLAEAETLSVRAELEGLRVAGGADRSATDGEARRVRARLAEAEAALETARRAAREGRNLTDMRLRLLLDTVVEASQGLRRELALPLSAPDATRPADVVAALQPVSSGVDDVSGRAEDGADPGLLDRLLGLPQVHLVVDGYNVTKLGYGGLPLQSQRERLTAGLAAIAARSGAEVTCCFDGAALDGPVVMATPRNVRVRFSLAGESADDLIRRLVAGEPPGRPVVVVSSDREVAEGVARSGARPVPSAALLRLLARS